MRLQSVPLMARPKGALDPESISTGRGRTAIQIIFLAGRESLQVARGPRDFRLERHEGETEEAFRARALEEATKRHMTWIAFERPALPARATPAVAQAANAAPNAPNRKQERDDV